jgi:hypothetical protein
MNSGTESCGVASAGGGGGGEEVDLERMGIKSE